jgi:hypothetical protein
VLHHLFGAVFGHDWGSFNYFNYAHPNHASYPGGGAWPHRGCVEA